MPDLPLIDALPAAVAVLVRVGKLAAAEQKLLRLLPAKPPSCQAAMALGMALVWQEANDMPRARSWLTRMPACASATLSAQAARLAFQVRDVNLAHDWFDRAIAGQGATGLGEEDRLLHGRSTLAAAELARIPKGRQGSWQQHLALLWRAETLLGELASSASDPNIRAEAAALQDRASRLLGARVPRRVAT